MGEKMPGWRGFVAAVAVEVRAGPGWELGSANYAARGQLLLLAGVQPEQKMQTVTICTAKFLTGSSGSNGPDPRPKTQLDLDPCPSDSELLSSSSPIILTE